MSHLTQSLSYSHKPIRSLAALSSALRVSVSSLYELAAKANNQYRLAKPIIKKDGSIRQPFDALPELKNIQKRILHAILQRTNFPAYLTGSIKGQDAHSNAKLHAGAAIVVCEDIKNFFPSTTSSLVRSIWNGFYSFSSDVADLLTILTTKDGGLPQGAVTSSYLANLAFWSREGRLKDLFYSKGITYSRYVDDITISSKLNISRELLTWCISQIYGMMLSCGFLAHRGKQEIQRGDAQMRVTKLVVNDEPALPHKIRKAIRAAVFQLESTKIDKISSTALNSITGRVCRLAQMHASEGALLKARVDLLKRRYKDYRHSAQLSHCAMPPPENSTDINIDPF